MTHDFVIKFILLFYNSFTFLLNGSLNGKQDCHQPQLDMSIITHRAYLAIRYSIVLRCLNMS